MAVANKIANLRGEADALISRDQPIGAGFRLAKLWRAESSPASAAFVVSRFEKLRGRISLVPLRLASLRSFTVEPAVPLLRAAAFSGGIDLSVHVGDFNAYAQEILDPDSSLYRFAPNAVILAVQTADVAPDLWRDYADMSGEAVEQAVKRVSTSESQWMSAFCERPPATLIRPKL